MPIQHTRFLGASLANFNGSVGWNADQSQLSLILAEDTRAEGNKYDWSEYDTAGNLILIPNGRVSSTADIFNPPPIGYPCHFKISDDDSAFFFNGILKDWRKHNGNDGEIFEVTLVDPRHILAGCQVIIDGFTGSVNNVPNLLNVYGYLENISYGYSRVNEAGLPWGSFLEGVNALVNAVPVNANNAQFGGPLKFRGQTYRLDLSALPSAPYNYRLGGATSISLLDAISQLCEDSGRDFIVRLGFVGGLNYIKVLTVSRRTQPSLNRIQQFLNTVPNVIVKNRGLELRAETTSSFLIGDKVQQLYKQQYSVSYNNGDMFDLLGYTGQQAALDPSQAAFLAFSDGPNNASSQKFNQMKQDAIQNTIHPYWGLDANGNAIIGVGFGNYHTFQVDSRKISHINGVESTMILHAAELRAALAGESEWINWVANFSKWKAKDFNLLNLAELTNTIVEANEDLEKANIFDMLNLTAEKLLHLTSPEQMGLVHEIYEFVHHHAAEYYGRKFMVKVPFVFAKIEDDSTRLVTSYEPTDSAFLSESDWNNGITPFGLPELFWDLFQPNADGKFGAFVRFDNVADFNLAELNPADYVVVYGDNGEGPTTVVTYAEETDILSTSEETLSSRLYIRCEIEPNLVFVDRANASDPRVVITLPAPITPKPNNNSLEVTESLRALNKALEQKAKDDNNDALNAAFARVSLAIQNSGFTGEPGKYGSYPLGTTPTYAAVPLRSNTLHYGPWYAVGAQGGVRYEQNETLAPWNFNGYTLMNQTANALVSEAYTNMQIAELGDVEIPNIPNIELGSELIAGGPIITNIRCSVGQDGVKTNYNMETYKVNPYGLNKQNYDRIQRLNKELIQVRRTILEQTRLNLQGGYGVSPNQTWTPNLLSDRRISKARRSRSPHSMIFMSAIDSTEIESPVDGQHTYNQRIEGSFRSIAEMQDGLAFYLSPDGVAQYPKVAAASLDNLLVPYSTDTSNIYLPHFVEPENPNDNSNRSVNHLHPYYDNFSDSENPVSVTHAQIVTWGTQYPNKGIQTILADDNGDPLLDGQKVQSIALKGPIVIAGWGYDIDNKPVPNENPSSPTDNFITNYRSRPDLWPAGPLDVKWDADRGVWTASATMVEGLLATSLTPSGSAVLNIYNIVDGVWTNTEETVLVTDRAGWLVNSGKWLMATKINGQYRPVAAECG